jgi:hypothetical protein
MTSISSFLHTLEVAANQTARAESDFRRDLAERVKALERERAFSHRRLNFMRAIADAIAAAESEEIAVAAAAAVMQAKLGWSTDSDARTEVLSHFVPVVQQVLASLAPATEDGAPLPDVLEALTEFETWYRETHPNPFWMLFENQMPETPLVDF